MVGIVPADSACRAFAAAVASEKATRTAAQAMACWAYSSLAVLFGHRCLDRSGPIAVDLRRFARGCDGFFWSDHRSRERFE
jgi:hypothetical protein